MQKRPIEAALSMYKPIHSVLYGLATDCWQRSCCQWGRQDPRIGGGVRSKSAICVVVVGLAVAVMLTAGPRTVSTTSETNALSLIVQAKDLASAAQAVRSVGGTITHELAIINAVGARLTAAQLETLRRSPEVRRIYPNRVVKTAGGGGQGVDTFYPRLVGADRLHMEGIVGTGVTVAVEDTGLKTATGTQADDWVFKNIYGAWRLVGAYYFGNTSWMENDPYGHGTHVTSIIANSRPYGASYNGIAPNVGLVV